VTAGWGDQAAASDRLFAFDLTDGRAVWQATPGGRPQDNSFASPVVASVGGRRVLYAGMGDGSVACVDARSGEPLWRHPLSAGGVNASAVLRGDDLIVIHGKENLEASTTGGMVALRVAGDRAPGRGRQLWRNDLCSFSSSPVLVDDRVYVTEQAGALCCVDADTGAVRWREKLGTDQLHASPTWADGRLYVPMHDGTLVVVRASDDGARRLQTLPLDGQCLGAPAIADGRVYVLTTAALYCFAGGRGSAPVEGLADAGGGSPPPAHLQIVPCDVLAYPGETVTFAVRRLDSTGHELPRAADAAVWRTMPGAVSLAAPDRLAIAADAPPFTATLNATAAQCLASVRLRVVPRPPFALDFDSGPRPGPPPSWWLGAAGKWEVLELDGDGVLARTLDVPLFQRAQSLIGHPLMSAYTMQVDLRADGNARSMGSVGVIHQRYLIVLKGNHQELEITSSLEVFKRSTAFAWQPGAWYHLRTRVAVGDDGSAVITAKAWPRDAEEPADWTLTARDPQGHRQGAPGIYGFTPQSRHRVYLDNLTVTADD
jgi:hypothetical protein